jgi:hypothetical protein
MQNRIFSFATDKQISDGEAQGKETKARDYGYLNAIHYMAPFTLGGVGNLCPNATAGCKALCLGEHSGQAGMVKRDDDMNSVRLSRRAKAQRFMRDRKAYVADIVKAIELAQKKAASMGLKLCVRLNGSTDIAWEGIYHAFPDIQFVDYTKNPYRFDRALPSNLHLTFSRSETNEAQALKLLSRGFNVAVVFGGERPAAWNGCTVIDGDQHDLRHLDPRADATTIVGYVVGLSPKGRKAKKDQSGFVVR